MVVRRRFSNRGREEEGLPRRGRQSHNGGLIKTTVFFFLESEVGLRSRPLSDWDGGGTRVTGDRF